MTDVQPQDVATNLLRAPLASGKHDITILTRRAPTSITPGVSYKIVDYSSVDSLAEALEGFEVVLSFLIVMDEAGFTAQKNLIDAAVLANVPRLSPSEWAVKTQSGIPSYVNKDRTMEYLATLKIGGKSVIEYCAFQPSIFMDYFAHPHPLSPTLHTWPFFVDFETRRAIVFEEEELNDRPIVVTAISDISDVLDLALEDEARAWPTEGGMQGARTSINGLLALGREIRGGEWSVTRVKKGDIEKGVLDSEWVPQFSHPAVPEEAWKSFSTQFVVMFLQAVYGGAWDVNDEWNKRFPEYKFTGLEEYLRKAWEGKA